ncbi:multidrug efflux pump subunit AcrB [Anseongella ginsenosidimutans]|uniref:Multidrug efflux pump subunit AcrB n=1 Tax=Anseongella ginsenosidimutans TaxID=496056 RepID=A0A4R3KKQ4_9SPHI|nr:efflux RND transporter permease subunit [Anseongella ginsenosidimutans]QEC52460.1 efflux RND transporter permease subunit [Anseongella ginsenosidimutans]TCS84247.1 multidrug efflux pump subunit AcrB [Anseongella ginsenosidimutans]
MIRFLVKRPVAVIVSFIALLLIGAAAALFIPVSLLPDIDVPEITVQVDKADASSGEIEQAIIRPIREGLVQLHGLERIESTSREGRGTVRLSFEHGTNTDLAFIEVNEKIDRSMNRLPRDVERPLVVKASTSDIPAFYLNVQLKNTGEAAADERRFLEFSDFVRQILKRRLEQLPEVAMVDLSGLEESEILISPYTGKLRTLGLTPAAVQQALQEHNIQLGNILVRDGHYQYYLRFSSGLYSTADIKDLYLNISGRLFRLEDIASVRLVEEQAKGAFFSGQHRAISMAVIKQSSARMEDLRENTRQLMTLFEKDYPGMSFELAQDQSALLDYSISNLKQDLLIGGSLAFLLMLAFIKKLRAAVLIGITIPVSLVISQLVFFMTGLSINIISLSGLILGLGMIIDNSIVVIDNITQHREKGLSLEDACVAGTEEVIRPLISSVLTNCAVFLPLIFLSGIAGTLFYDQALSITIGIIVSLFVSVLLLPVLYRLLHRGKQDERPPNRKWELLNVTGWYEAGLAFVFKRKALSLSLSALLLAAGAMVYMQLDKERFPRLSRADFEMFIDWNEAIPLEENQARTLSLLNTAGEQVQSANSWIGQQQYLLNKTYDLSLSESKTYINTPSPAQVAPLEDLLSAKLQQQYPQAILRFSAAKTPFEEVFGEKQAPLRVEISDQENNNMPAVGETAAVMDAIRSRFPDVSLKPLPLRENLILSVRTEQALLYNVPTDVIRNTVETALKSKQVSTLRGGQSVIPIVMGSTEKQPLASFLSTAAVRSNDSVYVPLASLVNMEREHGYKYISAGRQGQYYPIAIETEEPEAVLKEIQENVSPAFPELSFSYSGSYFFNNVLIKEMAVILVIAVLLLYFILAAQFESLMQPLIILLELPIDIAGALLMLYIFGGSINLMSMIGIIVMCGIIINDSILKIDAINQLRKKGYGLMEAIRAAGHTRLKSIVMISLTTVGALSPTLFMHDIGSELQRPLALTLIGGMLLGMVVSLLFIPLVYWFIYRNSDVPGRDHPGSHATGLPGPDVGNPNAGNPESPFANPGSLLKT